MLRESSNRSDALDSLNLQGTVNPDADSGVPHGSLLTAFAEAAVRQTDALPGLREQIVSELGVQELVDAAGVVANFQRMVRIADGCGIPLGRIHQGCDGRLPGRTRPARIRLRR